MKELTIEEKAKRYDEALEKARCKYQDHDTPWSDEDIEDIFPELAESEDERIRKELIENFKFFGGEHLKTSKWGKNDDLLVTDILAWLEKQGEQKPTNLAKGEDYGIDGLYNAIRILEKTLGKVEGYQSDDGILEHECAISAVKKLYEQKPAWSEEDERMLIDALDMVEWYIGRSESKCRSVSDWLKSLKDRVHPQEKQWKPSEEQLGALEHFVRSIGESGFASPYDSNTNLVYSLLSELKKLREE